VKTNAILKRFIEVASTLVVSIGFFILYVERGLISIYVDNHNLGPILYLIINTIISCILVFNSTFPLKKWG
jgi:hypothetical protein